MRTKQAVEMLSDLCKKSRGTVADRITKLQAAGLFAKGERGRHGGMDLIEADIVSGFLALLIDTPYGGDAASMVRRLRSMPCTGFNSTDVDPNAPMLEHARSTVEFTKGLTLNPQDGLGAVLDSVIHDIRTGRWFRWMKGTRGDCSLELHADGSSGLTLFDRPDAGNAVAISFRHPSTRHSDISKIVRVQQPVFGMFANMLGPLAPD